MEQLPLFAATPFSVSDLTRYVRQLLESDPLLQDVWVGGEISNLSRPSSGHVYFTLKDANASLRCVIWRSAAARIRMGLRDGMAVEAHGSIGVYEPSGQYQLYVDMLRPVGEGRLFQEFMRLKAKLEAEGLFDEERKQPLPERPKAIAVVTSPTGAALQDVLNTLQRRYPLGEVLLAATAVQGVEAPGQIVAALELAELAGPDVILVVRGGGSLEDLWAFNDEQVVRAIARCGVPVVTGVGHETDFTLADFAADRRAPTPTGAAVMATPDAADFRLEINDLRTRMAAGLAELVARRRDALQQLDLALERGSPLRRIQDNRQRIDDLSLRALQAARHRLELDHARLDGQRLRLAAMSPFGVLERGYALVSKVDGSLVRSAKQVTAGDALRVRVHDGEFDVNVDRRDAPVEGRKPGG